MAWIDTTWYSFSMKYYILLDQLPQARTFDTILTVSHRIPMLTSALDIILGSFLDPIQDQKWGSHYLLEDGVRYDIKDVDKPLGVGTGV